MIESNADAELVADVKNGTLLGFGSANPCTEETFDAGCYAAYQGRAQAVIRADAPGRMELTVQGGGLEGSCAVEVKP